MAIENESDWSILISLLRKNCRVLCGPRISNDEKKKKESYANRNTGRWLIIYSDTEILVKKKKKRNKTELLDRKDRY